MDLKRTICVLTALALLVTAAGCLKVPVFSVQFEANGGSVVSGELTQEIQLDEDAEPPVLERAGYEFLGWEGDWRRISEDTTVSALWDKLITVSFDPGEGELEGESVFVLRQGETPNAPEPTREGYVFEGWEPAVAPASEDITYTAQWSRKKLNAEEIFALVSPAVIEIRATDMYGMEWQGSGFFIDDAGTAVTNFHVMVGAVEATAVLSDGTEVSISGVYDYDKDLDVCLIRVLTRTNEFINVSDEPARTGQTIYAVGSPQGYTSSISSGIVSSESRDIDGVDCIQITAPISPGNSGGPLVNEYGEVLGITAMSRTDGQNLNFAIGIDQIQDLAADLHDAMHLRLFAKRAGSNHMLFSMVRYAEKEENNSPQTATPIIVEEAYAGEIYEKGDVDYFSVQLTAGQNIGAFIYYSSYFNNIAFEIGMIGENGFVLFECDCYEVEGGYVLDFTAPEDGTYYLVVYSPDADILMPISYAVFYLEA